MISGGNSFNDFS